jgi:hypothetical protein
MAARVRNLRRSTEVLFGFAMRTTSEQPVVVLEGASAEFDGPSRTFAVGDGIGDDV